MLKLLSLRKRCQKEWNIVQSGSLPKNHRARWSWAVVELRNRGYKLTLESPAFINAPEHRLARSVVRVYTGTRYCVMTHATSGRRCARCWRSQVSEKECYKTHGVETDACGRLPSSSWTARALCGRSQPFGASPYPVALASRIPREACL